MLKNLSFTLCIEMTKPSILIGNSYNEMQHSDSSIIDISTSEVSEYLNGDFKELTKKELDEVAFVGKTITFTDYVSKTFKNEKGFFSVKELLKNLVLFEKENRPHTEWFGGIDCHHVFFEGIFKVKGGAYSISWGS